MLSVNSIAINCPRPVCGTLSVAQTGTMAFNIPVPKPLIKRATFSSILLYLFEFLILDLPKIIQT